MKPGFRIVRQQADLSATVRRFLHEDEGRRLMVIEHRHVGAPYPRGPGIRTALCHALSDKRTSFATVSATAEGAHHWRYLWDKDVDMTGYLPTVRERRRLQWRSAADGAEFAVRFWCGSDRAALGSPSLVIFDGAWCWEDVLAVHEGFAKIVVIDRSFPDRPDRNAPSKNTRRLAMLPRVHCVYCMAPTQAELADDWTLATVETSVWQGQPLTRTRIERTLVAPEPESIELPPWRCAAEEPEADENEAESDEIDATELLKISQSLTAQRRAKRKRTGDENRSPREPESKRAKLRRRHQQQC